MINGGYWPSTDVGAHPSDRYNDPTDKHWLARKQVYPDRGTGMRLSVKPMSKSSDEALRRAEVIGSVQLGRRWSVAEKVQRVFEAVQPASVFSLMHPALAFPFPALCPIVPTRHESSREPFPEST